MHEVSLEAFQKQAAEDRAKYNAVAQYHLTGHTEGLNLPYQPDAQFITVSYASYVHENGKRVVTTEEAEKIAADESDNTAVHTVRGFDEDGNRDMSKDTFFVYDWTRVEDADKVIEYLKKVTKFARRHGYKVEKDYKYDFTVKITVPENEASPEFTISYSSDRETVCTKVVTGTKVIPATTTPERIEEIVEWDCNKIAFTA